MKQSILLSAYAIVVAAGTATAHEFSIPDTRLSANVVQIDSRGYGSGYDPSAEKECARRNDPEFSNQDNGDNRSNDMTQRGLEALDTLLGEGDRGEDTTRSDRPVSQRSIVRNLELNDFHDISRPVLNGGNYNVYAVDPDGQDVELVIDASNCEIVRTRDRS
jgi:hypothetical protein